MNSGVKRCTHRYGHVINGDTALGHGDHVVAQVAQCGSDGGGRTFRQAPPGHCLGGSCDELPLYPPCFLGAADASSALLMSASISSR